MFYRDHEPPHFHARYGDFEVIVTIADGRATGNFPRLALVLVLEWWNLRRDGLLANWERARQRTPLEPIRPLE